MAQNQIPNPSNHLSAVRNEVELTHRTIDTQTQRLRHLIGPQADATRRAEEAGAALHRLEWALERLQSLTSSEQVAEKGDSDLVVAGGS